MNNWIKEFPTEPGSYWFYGYRYGKISCGHDCEPELIFVEVSKISNGFMYVANSQFIFESEVEEPHFKKVELPELPELEE